MPALTPPFHPHKAVLNAEAVGPRGHHCEECAPKWESRKARRLAAASDPAAVKTAQGPAECAG